MDGIHDLGGKQGFGPIDIDAPEAGFHEPWEGRMWGLSRSTGFRDWTIDWWRHVRELIDPADYLTRAYFDRWAQTQIAAYIDSGVFTLEEIVSGRSAAPATDSVKALPLTDVGAVNLRRATRFDREIDRPAAYRPAPLL